MGPVPEDPFSGRIQRYDPPQFVDPDVEIITGFLSAQHVFFPDRDLSSPGPGFLIFFHDDCSPLLIIRKAAPLSSG